MEVEGTEDIALNMEEEMAGGSPSIDQNVSSLKHRLAVDFMAILSTAMEDTCFTRCIPKPGLKMSKNEERCLGECLKRFLEAWNITSQTVASVNDKMSNKL